MAAAGIGAAACVGAAVCVGPAHAADNSRHSVVTRRPGTAASTPFPYRIRMGRP